MFFKKTFCYALALVFAISYGTVSFAEMPGNQCEFDASCDDSSPLSNDQKRGTEGVIIGSGD